MARGEPEVADDPVMLLQQNTGFHLYRDFIDPMGAVCGLYASDTTGGGGLLSMVAFVELADAAAWRSTQSRVEDMIDKLGRIETETDELLDRACRSLFAMETELGVGTVYWHQILLWIADLADYAEKVGNRLRLLIAN